MSHTHYPKPKGAPRMKAPKPAPAPRMNRPSARYGAARASDRIMDVVEVGAVGMVGAGLLGTLGSSFQK